MTSRRTPIVADGRERALAGSEQVLERRRAEITAQVEVAHADRLANAGRLWQIWLRLRIRWHIRRAMQLERDKVAPSEALYLRP